MRGHSKSACFLLATRDEGEHFESSCLFLRWLTTDSILIVHLWVTNNFSIISLGAKEALIKLSPWTPVNIYYFMPFCSPFSKACDQAYSFYMPTADLICVALVIPLMSLACASVDWRPGECFKAMECYITDLCFLKGWHSSWNTGFHWNLFKGRLKWKKLGNDVRSHVRNIIQNNTKRKLSPVC